MANDGEPERSVEAAFADVLTPEATPAPAPTAPEPVATPEPASTDLGDQAPVATVAETETGTGTPAPAATATQRPGESDAAFEKRYWDSQNYIAQLHRENAELRAKSDAAKAAPVEAPAPQLTKEEQEAEATQLIQKIQRDPKGTIQALQREMMEKAQAGTLTQVETLVKQRLQILDPILAQVDQAQILQEMVPDFPEVADPKFQALMKSDAVTAAAWKQLPLKTRQEPDVAAKLYRDPIFYRLLYNAAKTAAAVANQPAAAAAASQAKEQLALAKGQTQVTGAGAAPGNPSGQPKLNQDDLFRQEVRNAGGSAASKMSEAFKPR